MHLDMIGGVKTSGVSEYRYSLPNTPLVCVIEVLRPVFWHMMEVHSPMVIVTVQLPACRRFDVVAPLLDQKYDFSDLPNSLIKQLFFMAEQWTTFATVPSLTYVVLQ